MLWLQTLPAFVLWIAYIYARRGWMMRSRKAYDRRSRAWRVIAMLGALLGSGTVLLGGLWSAVAVGWVASDGISPQGMVAVAAIGLLFVHLQMVAVAITLSLALERETGDRPPTSDSENHSGENQ